MEPTPNSWGSNGLTSHRTQVNVRSGNSQPSLPKRRKILLACNCCRARKTRCDGRRPICLTCEKRDTAMACLYEDSKVKTRRHIQTLETRLKRLEGNMASTTLEAAANRHARLYKTPLGRQEYHEHSYAAPSEDGQGGIGSTTPRIVVHASTRTFATETTFRGTSASASPDALATVSTDNRHSNTLYGSSSTIAFVEHVLHNTPEIDSARDLSGIAPDDSHSGVLNYPLAQTNKCLTEIAVLPTRKISDRFLQIFWEVTQPVFPVLHRPTLLAYYDTLWVSHGEPNEAPEDPIMLAIINIIFAIGCRFSKDVQPESRSTLSDQFYQRARNLVAIDALDVASVPIVQLLLLTAVHLQSTAYSSRCWNTVGLAIRVAQSIGLHLSNSGSGTLSQREREIRRRVWYTCVLLDRLICMAFGRPAMLSHDPQMPLPLMMDDEYLLEEGEGVQPTGLHSEMGLFIYSIQLTDILHEILSRFYGQDSVIEQGINSSKRQEKRIPDLHNMLRLNSKIDHFNEALPRHLRMSGSTDHADTNLSLSRLQPRILHCRTLYIRLLLLRPLVSSFSRLGMGVDSNSKVLDSNNLNNDIAEKMYQMCIRTAQELISVLHEDMDSLYRCSAWWTIYFAFGAVIVIAASRLYLPPGNSRTSIERSWACAMEIFEHYAPEAESAGRSIHVLDKISARLSALADKQAPALSREDVTETTGWHPETSFPVEMRWDSGTNDANDTVQDMDLQFLNEDWFSNEHVNTDGQDPFAGLQSVLW